MKQGIYKLHHVLLAMREDDVLSFGCDQFGIFVLFTRVDGKQRLTSQQTISRRALDSAHCPNALVDMVVARAFHVVDESGKEQQADETRT